MATTGTTSDRIEKEVTLPAPRSRVWRALTDHEQFGAWFGVKLATPFRPGAEVSGRISFKGNEFPMTIWIDRIEPETLFSFRWHPYAVDQSVDYSSEPKTLVTFTLSDAPDGTRLTILETGFDRIPEARRAQAFSMNTNGWNAQAENLRKYLATSRS
jgi:uncharacterized protein YndB with AHSA1/START domain